VLSSAPPGIIRVMIWRTRILVCSTAIIYNHVIGAILLWGNSQVLHTFRHPDLFQATLLVSF